MIHNCCGAVAPPGYMESLKWISEQMFFRVEAMVFVVLLLAAAIVRRFMR